ncbi:class I SAM-dependent methyltransferase [Legionella waltersii]|nr:class I SAM-dependent methyltransferase [Legionella waltersii]
MDLEDSILQIQTRILQEGNKPHVSVEEQFALLQQLSEFEFGRFLINNQGINGYWTHYMLTHPWVGRKTGLNNQGQAFTDLERFLLDQAPTMIATQQRFKLFLKENQKSVNDGAVLASIPSGLMGELLYLDLKQVNNLQLVGIDFDVNTLKEASALAEKLKIRQNIEFMHLNAWALPMRDQFDLISSNGLNIYEPEDEKVTDLYRQFYKSLRPGGKLVTSFLTHPPMSTEECEWVLDKVNKDHLLLQRIIFVDLLNAKFRCFRSTKQTQKQLESVGFNGIQFLYDEAHIFPTVIAMK